jgi:mannose-6-phosphate isomerase
MPLSGPKLGAFILEPQYREYVWGGARLRPGQLTAEAWVIYAGNTIRGGALAGRVLSDVAEEFGEALLGERVVARTGLRFPLLVKLLDCAQWLSLQVHPNDEQAVRLEGPGHFGKTEAWHILQADPGAEILCGFKPGVAEAAWKQAVRDGTLLDDSRRVPMVAGDTVFIRPGTMHALGPGLLVYEVQQTSDITYRVWDWDRPMTAGRKLHIEQSLEVIDPAAGGDPVPQPPFIDGDRRKLVSCPYFTLQMLSTERVPVLLDPAGETFCALTVIEGQIELRGNGWSLALDRFESAVLPASAGSCTITASSRARVLAASVEE